MRALVHPPVEEMAVENILYALADPVRAAMFAGIASAACAETCSTFLRVGGKDIPKSTLSQHFRVLREAGLIRSERHGVEMRNTSRCAEVDKRFPGLLAAILKAQLIQAGRNGKKKAKSAETA